MDNNIQDEFKEELNFILDNYGKKNQDGIKEALRYTQDIFKFISTEHQEKIAELFEVDIKIVTTLIKLSPSLKESIVEYEIVCCTGRRCAKNGSLEVIKAVKKELNLDFNETSADGKVRLISKNCFKKCNMGPNIMINNKLYHYMDKDKALKLIKDKVKDR